MAIKIVQTAGKLNPTVSVAQTSNPIVLKTGYLRVSTGATSVYVELGGNPLVTSNSFHVPPYSAEIIKERVAKQQIAGITTGTTTIITFAENAGHPFIVGDYVTIENAQPAGINTIHQSVTAVTDSSITISANTSSVVGIITATGSTVSRSIKIGSISENGNAFLSITEVQITSQA